MASFAARSLGFLGFLTLASCLGLVPSAEGPRSVGSASKGVLRRGVPLPEQGPGFVRARPGESTRYGTPTLVAALTRAAASVQKAYPGTAPLRVGDLSGPGGGRHPRHGSHRTGRDADVIFYLSDEFGRSVRGRGWLAFDRHGVALDTTGLLGAPANSLFVFDDARNWHFVRTLLADEEAAVQWIFCSKGIKARLLRYAVALQEDPEIIFRASWVLHQPARANPHADHFHIRVACSPEDRLLGCFNGAPVWPWIRKQAGKPADAAPPLDDEALLGMFLDR